MTFVSRFLVIVAVAAFAYLYQWKLPGGSTSNATDLAVTYTTPDSSKAWKRLSYKPPASQKPDTAVILLNWSRLPNVIRIVDTLCDESLSGVVTEIVVWNNSPQKISKETFSKTQCNTEKLRIHNSPSNIYFQARFLACAESSASFCFIQDDDYLILPEVLASLHAYVSRTGSSVHLLPPHERLSSDLRRVQTPDGIHTSFAWLGHGALVLRSQVVQFLDLMALLNATEDETKMADNYYTILGNAFVETWFDQGIELGGGQAFTVGTTGEERNVRHITRALEILESAVKSEDIALPYINRSASVELTSSRAACAGSACYLETNIQLLPSDLRHDGSTAMSMLDVERANSDRIPHVMKTSYLEHAPSLAVDGRPNTAFRSVHTAKANDTLSLDFFNPSVEDVELVFLVDGDTEPILGNAFFEMKIGDSWTASKGHLVCVDVDSGSILTTTGASDQKFRECGVKMLASEAGSSGAHAFRARLSINLPFKWVVYEMWTRTRL